MKALIKVGYGCNENCTFCHTDDMRHLEDTEARINWKIERARRLGYSMVVLSGGEPTMRPELLKWARRVARLGLDFGLVTNGLLLSYPHVVDELIDECRLRYVYMSLHGGSARVHRSVVRADTFAQAMAALDNLEGRIPDLTVNCDEGDLAEILSNLIDNACKWAEGNIKVAARRADGKIFIDVADDGPGIADDMRDKVFDVGARLDEGKAGSGLGLAIARDLARLYGGDLELEKAPAGGLLARLLLPDINAKD